MFNLKIKQSKNLLLLLFFDIALFVISYGVSYFLRFDLIFPYSEYLRFRNTLFPILLIKVFIFYKFGLYRGMWRYTSIKDLENIIKASLVSTASIIVYILSIYRFEGFARSIFLLDGVLTVFLIGGLRLSIRLFFDYKKRGTFFRNNYNNAHRKRKSILIIGAGDTGEKILREINNNAELNYEVIGFLDDDYQKIHRYIHGVKVIGRIDKVVSLVEKTQIDEIIIAIPSATGEKMREIISLCNNTKIPYKTVPGMGELIDGKVKVSKIRNVSYSDLLGRSQVELEMDKIGAYLNGKCVLVTGAGGSIGSELCRQIARFEPEVLIILDRAESSLYDIEMETRRLFPKQVVVPILASVTCLERLTDVFSQFELHVVFHAAAYKHVPMMELHPCEAIYNNIIGSKNVLDLAHEFGVERFILVSTDKAVRPANIMGATKRVAEIILQLNGREYLKKMLCLNENHSKTKVMAVRFGNVAGSAGSVIPLFKKQIENGGPITITHPDMTRYFMTISEAVQLILQAGAMGESGDIYILKMGKPVKIIDMANDLIRLSGLEPNKDIRIEITGLRPGEKLYEELITEGEGIVPTKHDKILVLRSNGDLNGHTKDKINKKINELVKMVHDHDIDGMKYKLKEIVPEYTPQFEFFNGETEYRSIFDLEAEERDLTWDLEDFEEHNKLSSGIHN